MEVIQEDNDDNDDKEEGDEKEYEKEYDDDSFSSAESERRSPFPSKVLFSRSKNIIDDMDYAMKKMSLRDKKPFWFHQVLVSKSQILCFFFLFLELANLRLIVAFSVTIEVNLESPELNREVLVYQIKDIPGIDKKKLHYNGFHFMMLMDLRWVLEDDEVEPYKARLLSQNSVLLQVPAWPYGVLFHREDFVDRVPTNTTDAMDDARHDYFADPKSRKFKHIVLEFPNDFVLSAKEIYSEAGDDDELELEIIPYEYDRPDENGRNQEAWAAWKVARTNIKAHKRGKVDSMKKKSKAAELWAKMTTSINSDGNGDDDDDEFMGGIGGGTSSSSSSW